MAIDRVLYHFTVDEYQTMAEAGVFVEGPRVELIEGEIIEMEPIGLLHASIVDRLNALFTRVVGDEAIVRVQSSIVLGIASQPEPDVALLRARHDWYAKAHPDEVDVFLVVEVSDTTVAFDRRVKVPLYAQLGVRECWIVDVSGGVVDVHRLPGLGSYGQVARYVVGQQISPEALPHVTLDVAEIFG